MGYGGVGRYAMYASGDISDKNFSKTQIPGAKVVMLPICITKHDNLLIKELSKTDILVDATARRDVSKVIVKNHMVKKMPDKSVILDLAADPYGVSQDRIIKQPGIEGIPVGNLSKYSISPEDEVYNQIPKQVNNKHRRHVVSCSAWSGIDPVRSMTIYGNQLPDFIFILLKKGPDNLKNNSIYQHERALAASDIRNYKKLIQN